MRWLLLTLCCCATATWAQSKKLVLKNKIKTCTEVSTKIEDGKTIAKKEFTAFDENGNKTEETIYLNDQLQEKETFQFNKANDVIQHVIYDVDGSIKKKITKQYNANGDLIEESTFDGQDKRKKKELTAYNAFGEKISEITYDGEGNLKEKAVYKHDGKGLKTERLTYDAEGRLVGKKTYTYTFKK